MYRIILGIGRFLIFLLLVGNRATWAQQTKPVAYENLPTIKVHIDKEIGAKQGYLPGKLKDLILMSDGTLLVSDLQTKMIVQFNARGNYVGIVARGGKGPGELPFFFTLIKGVSDTLLVWHDRARRLDYFTPDPEGIYKHIKSVAQHQYTGRRLQFIGTHSASRYYAMTGLPDAALIKRDLPDYRWSPVAVVDGSLNIVQDSLHMLKTPNNIFGDPEKYGSRITMKGLTYLGMPPYRYQDRLLPTEGGGYMIARPDSSALFVYGPDHMLNKRIPLPLKERTVRSSDLEHAFTSHPMAQNRRIRRELERHVPSIKPPFLNVWLSENHIWLHIDYTANGKQMLVFTMQGNPVGRFRLPKDDIIKVIRNKKIYTIHKDPAAGHSIRIYTAEL